MKQILLEIDFAGCSGDGLLRLINENGFEGLDLNLAWICRASHEHAGSKAYFRPENGLYWII